MICNNNTNNDHAATHANTKQKSLCTSVALRAAEPDLPLKLKGVQNIVVYLCGASGGRDRFGFKVKEGSKISLCTSVAVRA